MPKFKFNKLVRDKIVDHQIADGSKPQYRNLSDAEHKAALIKKIVEETEEIMEADDNEVAAEIADVQQALNDLITKYKLEKSDILVELKRKKDKNGGFKKGIFVEYVEVNNDSQWMDYYRKNSKRYPEIS